MKGNVLFSNQTGSNPGPEMLIKKPRYISGADILPTFKKATGKYRNGIGMRLNEVGHDFGELDLIFQVGDASLLVWQESREGMDVVVVDLSYMWIGDDNEGKVAECLDPMCEANRKQ